VGKALSFLSKLTEGLIDVCAVEDTTTRSTYEQNMALHEQMELRETAQAQCRTAQADLLKQQGEVRRS
jgi:hypothetical protein